MSKVECQPQYYLVEKYSGERAVWLAPDWNQGCESIEMSVSVIPEEVRELSGVIREKGGRAVLVGGCVRDMILGRSPKDYDVEVYGIESGDLERILMEYYGEDLVNGVGKAFGILKLNLGLAEGVDVSIPREDNKTGDGHKGFAVNTRPEMGVVAAALRRDLTINTLACEIETGRVYDSHGGLKDLADGIIRVTKAEKFVEDPLRVWRVVQFAARFGFEVEENTMNLCKQMVESGQLDSLPRERVTEEVVKLLVKGKKPSVGLELARELGLIERYLPELQALIGVPQESDWHPEGDVWNHTLQAVDAAALIRDRDGVRGQAAMVLMLGTLLHDAGKAIPGITKFEEGAYRSRGHEEAGEEPARNFMKRLSLSADMTEMVVLMVTEHMQPRNIFEEIAKGKTRVKSLIRRVNKLAKAGTDFATLCRVAEADSRGRNGSGNQPLERAQVHDQCEWVDPVLAAAEAIVVVKGKGVLPAVSGERLLGQLRGAKGGPWMGVLISCVVNHQLDGEVIDEMTGVRMAMAYHERLVQHVGGGNVWDKKHWQSCMALRNLEDPREVLGVV